MKNILILLLLIGAKNGISQRRSVPVPDSLTYGLYVKSLSRIIPWQTTLDSIHTYGSPKITAYKKKYTVVEWGPGEVLNGITGELLAFYWGTSGRRKLSYFKVILDSSQIYDIKTALEFYFNKPGVMRGVTKRSYFYEWNRYDCLIRLGLVRSDEYYFYISRK